jgi:hypothetical protein
MEHHGNDVCGGSCVDARRDSHAIPTVENLRGGSFSFPPPNPIGVKLVITFLLFVRSQHLIARNVCELFSSDRGVSHLNEACCIDELSRGSDLEYDILMAFGFGLP